MRGGALLVGLSAASIVMSAPWSLAIHDLKDPKPTLSGFDICSKIGDSFKINSIVYAPIPAKPGSNITFTLQGALAKDVVGIVIL